MPWQRKARFAIATFVIVFAVVVVLAMRQRAAAPPPPQSPRTDEKAVIQSLGPISHERSVAGKLQFALTGKDHKVYPDGRTVVSGVTLKLPERGGRTVTITSDRAEVTAPPDKSSELASARFTGNVTLTTDDGVRVTSAEATFDQREGIVKVPGPVEFSRGRMKGSGVGATYDNRSDVLWILDQARVNVAPDRTGAGAAEATARSAALARAEHYLKLTGAAHIVAEGSTIDADDATILLQEDGQTVREVQLRGNSRIVGTGAGARTMSARDIDLGYADDGRTLRSARLMAGGVLELPAAEGTGTRRVAGDTIQLGLAPDGTTLTSLHAVGNVQMDLPPAADGTTKRIRSASLTGAGADDAGLRQAVFDGPVEYTEGRPAQPNTPAVDRTARAARLIVETAPGLGTLERADFRGNVRITDGPDVSAGAPRALYHLSAEQIELSPSGAEPGPAPFVNDGQVLVEARNIRYSPSTRKLTADTDVRSTLRQKPGGNGRGGAGSKEQRLPSMLAPDKPVTVTANRVEYDGQAVAKYDGNARLWQDKSKVYADSIEIDDRTGNLTARGHAKSTMLLEDLDPKTQKRTVTETNATADLLVYDDAKRVATYTSGPTGRANIVGAQGDLTGDRIDLFLKEGGKELERAVADGNVIAKEGGRNVTGGHLVYTAANDTYVMTGAPVEVVRKASVQCEKTVCARLTFHRATDNLKVEDDGLRLVRTESIPCPPELRD